VAPRTDADLCERLALGVAGAAIRRASPMRTAAHLPPVSECLKGGERGRAFWQQHTWPGPNWHAGVLYYGDAAADGEKASTYVEELDTREDFERFINAQTDDVLTVVDVSCSNTPCIRVFPAIMALAKNFQGCAAGGSPTLNPKPYISRGARQTIPKPLAAWSPLGCVGRLGGGVLQCDEDLRVGAACVLRACIAAWTAGAFCELGSGGALSVCLPAGGRLSKTPFRRV
jgi:hypothetical protein